MALRTGLAAGVPLSTRVRLVSFDHPADPAQPGTTDSTKPETFAASPRKGSGTTSQTCQRDCETSVIPPRPSVKADGRIRFRFLTSFPVPCFVS